MQLSAFIAKYPPQAPKRKPSNDDELRPVTVAQGLMYLVVPPAETTKRTGPDDASGRHLWVFYAEAIPYLLEQAPEVSPALTSGLAKHTNLTGGEPAACGGEMWVDPTDPSVLYVNGASGRYGPSSESELNDAVHVFEHLGFDVRSFGWDEDAGMPARVYRP